MLDATQSVDAAARRRRGLLFVGLAVGAVGFAMAIQMAGQSNFVVEEMGLDPAGQGFLEAARESCGILALGVLALLAGLTEPLVGMLVLALFAVGLGAYNFVHTYTWLVLASLIWSQGLHVWMPLPNSMTLALAEPGRTGRRIGQIRAAGAIGSGAGLVVAYAFVKGYEAMKLPMPRRPLFLLAGAMAMVAAAACLGIPRNIRTPGPRIVFRRRYGLYYALCLLEGWRKQIFVAFATFLLVKKYGTPLPTMLGLWMAIQVICWPASPLVGRLIDRVGERRVLMFYYACLTVFFIGYAFVGSLAALYAIFIIDSAFFVFAMALTTYVGRIAPASEYTPTLSMGVAMNHVSAVTMPIVGGLLWEAWGYKWTFLVGAAAAAASIPVVMRLPRKAPPEPAPAATGEPAEHVEAP